MEKNKFETTFKLAASPKNIVSMYKITDDYILKFFIYRYGENMMPSEQEQKELDTAYSHLEESERLRIWLENKLDNIIKAKTDMSNPSSNYFKDVSKIKPDVILQAHGHLPNLQEAKAKYEAGDVKGATEEILRTINSSKESSFKRWISQMESGNYDKIFSFMLLDQVIDSSPSEKMGPPPVVFDQKAIDSILNDVVEEGKKESPIPFNLYKKYRDLSSIKSENKGDKLSHLFYPVGEQKEGVKTGWWHLPMKALSESDPEKWRTFDENLKIMMNLGSRAGWCIGGSDRAVPYLTDGDFYIYTDESGEPKVAIRFGGQNQKILELRGKNNETTNVTPYWRIIVDFAQKMGIVDKLEALPKYYDEEWKLVKKTAKRNSEIMKSPEALKEFENLILNIRDWSRLISEIASVDEGVFNANPNLQEAVKKSLKESLSAAPYDYMRRMDIKLPKFLLDSEEYAKGVSEVIEKYILRPGGGYESYSINILNAWDSLPTAIKTEELIEKAMVLGFNIGSISLYSASNLPKGITKIVQKSPKLYNLLMEKLASAFGNASDLLRMDISRVHSFLASPRSVQKAFRMYLEKIRPQNEDERTSTSFGANMAQLHPSWRRILEGDAQFEKIIWDGMAKSWQNVKKNVESGLWGATTFEDYSSAFLKRAFSQPIKEDSLAAKSGIAYKILGEAILGKIGISINDKGEVLDFGGTKGKILAILTQFGIDKSFLDKLPEKEPKIAESIKSACKSVAVTDVSFINSIFANDGNEKFKNLPSWVLENRNPVDIVYDSLDKVEIIPYILYTLGSANRGVSTKILADEKISNKIAERLLAKINNLNTSDNSNLYDIMRWDWRAFPGSVKDVLSNVAPRIFAQRVSDWFSSGGESISLETVHSLIKEIPAFSDDILNDSEVMDFTSRLLLKTFRKSQNKTKSIQNYISSGQTYGDMISAINRANPAFKEKMDKEMNDMVHQDAFGSLRILSSVNYDTNPDFHESVSEIFPEILYEAITILNRDYGEGYTNSLGKQVYRLREYLSTIIANNREWQAYVAANKDKIYQSYITASLKAVTSTTDVGDIVESLDRIAEVLGIDSFSKLYKNNKKIQDYVLKNSIDKILSKARKPEEGRSWASILMNAYDNIKDLIYTVSGEGGINQQELSAKLAAFSEEIVTHMLKNSSAYEVFKFVEDMIDYDRSKFPGSLLALPSVRNMLIEKFNSFDFNDWKDKIYYHIDNNYGKATKYFRIASYLKSSHMFNMTYNVLSNRKRITDLMDWYQNHILDNYNLVSSASYISNDVLEYYPALKEKIIERILKSTNNYYGDLYRISHDKDFFNKRWPLIMSDQRVQTALTEYEEKRKNASMTFNLFKLAKK